MTSLEQHTHHRAVEDRQADSVLKPDHRLRAQRRLFRQPGFSRMSRPTPLPPAQRWRLAATAAVFAVALALAAVLTPSAQAQTYSVIYNFSGGDGGAQPMAGLTFDGVSSLYGTANAGGVTGGSCGSNGCGMVYRLTNGISGWSLSPLYEFTGGADGQNPQTANVVFGPNGALYSSTFLGGGGCNDLGCGTIFKLFPSRTGWVETVIHRFGGLDGAGPVGSLVFDHLGNVDGATNEGGIRNGGVVYQLNAAGGYREFVLFHPYGYPGSSVTIDHAGDLYGTTFNAGANDFGSVYKLTSNGIGFTSTELYDFTNTTDGEYPKAGVILDQAGNLYGATSTGGSGHGGTIFKLAFSNGGYTFSTIYSFRSPSNGQQLISGPIGNLTIDGAGNLYGTTLVDGAHGYGSVFKLTPSNGSWTYTSLHDFTNGSDGGLPFGNLIIDSHGTIYGTASTGGASGLGVVFQITP